MGWFKIIRLSVIFIFLIYNNIYLHSQVWSTNGKKIAFFYIHNIEDIYTVNPDGSDFHIVDGHPNRDFGPQWSPNGKNLVFNWL